jgi:HEPN domain-containing protein
MAVKKIPDFRRAAKQRLAAVEHLLTSKDGEQFRDAMYLCGYVIECSLKALILRRTPRRQQRVMFERISRGVEGHDFDRLENVLRTLGCHMPDDVVKHFGYVSDWSTDWRYDVGAVSKEDASAFVTSAEYVRAWVERSW